MTDMRNITSQIRGFVESRIGRPVADDEKYFETGAVSSMFGLQLISYIEQEFGIEVSDDDLVLENFESVENLVAFVGRKL